MIKKVYVKVTGTSVAEVSKMSLSKFNESKGVYYCYATANKLCTDLTNADIKQLYMDEKAMWDASPASKPTYVIFCEEDKSFYVNASGIISKYGVGSDFGDMATDDTDTHPESFAWQRVTLSTTPPTSAQIGNLQLQNSSGTTIYAYWTKGNSDRFILNYNFSDTTDYPDGGFADASIKSQSVVYYADPVKCFRRNANKISSMQYAGLFGSAITANVKGEYFPAVSPVRSGTPQGAWQLIPSKTLTENLDTTTPAPDAITSFKTAFLDGPTPASFVNFNNWWKSFSMYYGGSINSTSTENLTLNSSAITYVPYVQGAQDLFGIAAQNPKKSVGFFVDLVNVHGVKLLNDSGVPVGILSQSSSGSQLHLTASGGCMGSCQFEKIGNKMQGKDIVTTDRDIQVVFGVRMADNSIKYTILPQRKLKFLYVPSSFIIDATGYYFLNSTSSVFEKNTAYGNENVNKIRFNVLEFLKELNLDACFSFLRNKNSFIYNSTTKVTSPVGAGASYSLFSASTENISFIDAGPSAADIFVLGKLGSNQDVEAADNMSQGSSPVQYSSSTSVGGTLNKDDAFINVILFGTPLSIYEAGPYVVYPAGLP